MNKILISGYYGYDNLGDEAVLETILKNIRSAVHGAEITVLSSDPVATMTKYNVRSVGRSKWADVFKAIWDCDLLISGGGSLLQDVTSRLSIFYYLLIILGGRCMGKKVMVYSQGIGPIQRPVNRIMTKWILKGIDAITVRESYSKKDLIDIGIPEHLIEVTADPVVSMDVDAAADGRRLLKAYMTDEQLSKPIIGFALRGKAYTPELGERIRETVMRLQATMNVTIVFIPFYYNEDLQTIRGIREVLNGDVVYLDQRHDAKEVLGIMKELDLLVGERLHSLIFAAICCVPMIALSYDPKIDYFMETIQSKVEFHIHDFNSDDLVARINETLENKVNLRNQLHENMHVLKSKLTRNAEIVKQMLD